MKILDFGLAKLRPQRNESVSSELDTRKQITDPGTVMGTVGYMSSEQVRGHEADPRSDIFSFGAILYEMLAGQRAFRRDTMAETMTAIIKEDPPDITETNSKVPAQLERIVRRCLEKKPERRFHSAHDLGFALEGLSAPSSTDETLPQCNRVENDDAPVFCRADGTPLVSDSASVNADAGTVRFGSAPVASEVETSIPSQMVTDSSMSPATGPTAPRCRRLTL